MNKNTGEKIPFEESRQIVQEWSALKKIYGVTIAISQEETDDQHFSCQVRICSKPSKHKAHLLEIDKMDVRINHQIPHKDMDLLAYKCGSALYPLRVLIDNHLQIVNIANYKKMVFRWLKIKKEMTDRFEGDTRVIKYLKATEATLLNIENILGVLKRDLFLSSYFTDLYGQYKYSIPRNKREELVEIPVIPNTKPVCYTVLQHVSNRFTSYETITVTREGHLNDERSAEDISGKKEFAFDPGAEDAKPASGSLSATYQLDRKEKTIDSIMAKYAIELPHGESRHIQLNAFHLERKDNKFKTQYDGKTK